MNPNCPYCGGLSTLYADVKILYADVPLGRDGYEDIEAYVVDDEILAITCDLCGRDVTFTHWYDHGEDMGDPCDCKEQDDNE